MSVDRDNIVRTVDMTIQVRVIKVLTGTSCCQNQLNLRALHDGLTFLKIVICYTLHPVQWCARLLAGFTADADSLGSAFGGLGCGIDEQERNSLSDDRNATQRKKLTMILRGDVVKILRRSLSLRA